MSHAFHAASQPAFRAAAGLRAAAQDSFRRRASDTAAAAAVLPYARALARSGTASAPRVRADAERALLKVYDDDGRVPLRFIYVSDFKAI